MLEAIGFRKEVGRVEVTFKARTKVKRAKKPKRGKRKKLPRPVNSGDQSNRAFSLAIGG